jgi:hypothetical protein
MQKARTKYQAGLDRYRSRTVKGCGPIFVSARFFLLIFFPNLLSSLLATCTAATRDATKRSRLPFGRLVRQEGFDENLHIVFMQVGCLAPRLSGKLALHLSAEIGN